MSGFGIFRMQIAGLFFFDRYSSHSQDTLQGLHTQYQLEAPILKCLQLQQPIFHVSYSMK